ncbi:MAG TPA: SGNH/GDSL hydrolase family protein [Candidatus Hydrogenedentes bacterium]|nr:SGNH/GDSL hydrolase family protein [Candidatus Hydrogenedentota bacterium]HIJ73597.1 SGNH/GDSL hydrolase family protein [Candidatus Hydrogenedentota bacterium]
MSKRRGFPLVRVLSLLVFATGVLFGASVRAEEGRILVVGDSWAAGIFGFQAFPKVLAAHGIEDVGVIGAPTAIGGSRADQWAGNHKGMLDALTKTLKDNPTVDIVHVSIGGNDFLSAAMEHNENVCVLPPDERKAIWERIWADIETLVRHILAQREDIKVLLNDYDYLDPALMRKTFSLRFAPTLSPKQMNATLIEFGRLKRERVAKIDRCEYIQHFGLLQHHYGVPPDLEKGTAPLPGGPPDYEPFAGGNPELANSPEAMPDGVHPMPEGYQYIIERCYQAFYKDWLSAQNAKEEMQCDE